MAENMSDTMTRQRILVVDDEKNICDLLCAVLKSKYDVEASQSVKKALELIDEHRGYDLYVTDLRLPDGSGIDVLRKAKAIDHYSEVIIITAYASLDTAMSAVNLGAYSYLTKPVSLAHFTALVEKALMSRMFHLESKRLLDQRLGGDQDARQHFLTITAIYELSQKLMLFLDVNDIMQAILHELVDKLHAVYAFAGVSLFGQADLFVMPASGACDAEGVRCLLQPHWDKAFAILDRQLFAREKTAIHPLSFGKGALPAGESFAIAMIPMIVMGRPIGVLALLRPESAALTVQEYQFFHVFSSLASPLVENCYIHQRTKLQASIDGLTGIANHRSFQEMLSREIARADRDKTDFCLCMMDIDDFKKVNDTYGHLIGDAVLKDLPGRINPTIRECDIFARYGGEEFALILSNTPIDGAAILAERILKEISQRPYSLGEIGISYTISIGIALYSGKNPRKKELLIRDADEALYTSKTRGKNRVTVHQ